MNHYRIRNEIRDQMNTKNLVQIAAKLYDARDAMRGLWRDKYAEKVDEYQLYIRAGMEKYKCNEMKSAINLLTLLQEKEPDSGMQQALILAAYLEMIDPSPSDQTLPTPL